jgi:tetratricopeptide (TPR) repeat protein
MLRLKRTIKTTFVGLTLLVLGSVASAQQDLNSALRLTYQEQFDAADNAFSNLIKSDPANGKYYYYSGENQLASYFIDPVNISFESVAQKAVDRFNQGITANPNEPLNYVGIGKVALIEGKKSIADENFAKAETFLPAKRVKSNLTKPEQSMLLVRLAEAYVSVGSRDTARVFSYLRRAEAIDRQNPELYLVRGDYFIDVLNDGSHAAENYKRAQDYSPQSTRARLRLGQLYTRIRVYQDALSYYQDALSIDPSFAPAYLQLGFLYTKTNQPEEAKKNFKKYLDLSSSNIAAKRRYANMLIQTEDYKGAIDQINQILAIDSVTYNDLNRALAYSYFEVKEYPEAKYYSEKFFRTAQPDKITSKDYIYYGRILIKSGNDSLGIINLTKAFDADTNNVDILNEVAATYLKIKKYKEAGDTYKLKIEHSNNPGVNDYYKMARAYFDAKAWTEADSAFAKVSRMAPDFEPAFLFRARIYSNLDPDTKEGLAKPYYETLIEKASADSVKYSKDILEAYRYLGYYYIVIKDYCQSLVYWDRIVFMDPADENAATALKDLKKNCPEFKSAFIKPE